MYKNTTDVLANALVLGPVDVDYRPYNILILPMISIALLYFTQCQAIAPRMSSYARHSTVRSI